MSQEHSDQASDNRADDERRLLKTMILNPACIAEVAGIVSRHHFSEKVHAVIFETLVAMNTEDISIDLDTLEDQLSQRGVLDEIDGDYLASLAIGLAETLEVADYARQVRDTAISQRLLVIAATLWDRVMNDEDADTIATWARRELDTIMQPYQNDVDNISNK